MRSPETGPYNYVNLVYNENALQIRAENYIGAHLWGHLENKVEFISQTIPGWIKNWYNIYMKKQNY